MVIDPATHRMRALCCLGSAPLAVGAPFDGGAVFTLVGTDSNKFKSHCLGRGQATLLNALPGV